MNRIVIVFLAAFILVSCSSKFSKILKSKDVEYKYKMAEQYYAKKDYSKAQVLYEDIFQVMKGTPRYEDMYYKFAYSYYYQKRLLEWPEKLVQEFYGKLSKVLAS